MTRRFRPRRIPTPIRDTMLPEERARRADRWRLFNGLPAAVPWFGPGDPCPEPPADWQPPAGCFCPDGAERACDNPVCPRQSAHLRSIPSPEAA